MEIAPESASADGTCSIERVFEFIERWRVRKLLRKFGGSEVLDLIDKAPHHRDFTHKLEVKHFQFIVIQVNGSEPEPLSHTIGRICEVLSEHNAMPPDFGGGFVICYLGARDPELDSPELRAKIVNSLLSRLGNQIRIVHGQCTTHFGFYGSNLRFTYGAIIPRFPEIVDELTCMHDGTAIEIF